VVKANRGFADRRAGLPAYTFVPMAERGLTVEEIRIRCKKGGRWIAALTQSERAFAQKRGWL
jgi:hypothetical protein